MRLNNKKYHSRMWIELRSKTQIRVINTSKIKFKKLHWTNWKTTVKRSNAWYRSKILRTGNICNTYEKILENEKLQHLKS